MLLVDEYYATPPRFGGGVFQRTFTVQPSVTVNVAPEFLSEIGAWTELWDSEWREENE